MKSYSANRLGKFVWGSVSGAIASLLVFTALFFLHCEETGVLVSQTNVDDYVAYVPWIWVGLIAAFFGLLNAGRSHHRDSGSVWDVVDVLEMD